VKIKTLLQSNLYIKNTNLYIKSTNLYIKGTHLYIKGTHLYIRALKGTWKCVLYQQLYSG